MKFKLRFIGLMGLLLSSCTNPLSLIFKKTNNLDDETEQNLVETEYEYSTLQNGKIKLTRYKGEYKPFIKVPTKYDGKEVVSIGKGCFSKNSLYRQRKRSETLENDDCSTYYIDSSIDNIEDGAFESNDSFITDADSNNENWEDTAFTGSAQDGEGNVYYSVSNENTFIENDIVYVYTETLMGYFLARCLSQEKEIVIPDTINGKKVVNIGMDSFLDNRYVEKVNFPKTIGRIFNRAFENCTNLAQVEFNCPNLGSINTQAFLNCASLDVIKLPSGLTTIGSRSFSYCGKINEFYMPASVNTLYSDAFFETTIKTLYFAGTQERFETRVLKGRTDMFPGTTIIYGGQELDAIEIDDFNEIQNLQNDTKVTISGIISGFYNYYSNTGYRDLMIIDPETNIFLRCYNHRGLAFSEQIYIGRKVTVTGYKSTYYGTVELIDSEFVLHDEYISSLSPLLIDFEDENFLFDDYLNHYCYLEATIKSTDGYTVFFENINGFIGFSKNTRYELYSEMSVGNLVRIIGWAEMYNQTPEFTFDIRNVYLLNQAN